MHPVDGRVGYGCSIARMTFSISSMRLHVWSSLVYIDPSGRTTCGRGVAKEHIAIERYAIYKANIGHCYGLQIKPAVVDAANFDVGKCIRLKDQVHSVNIVDMLNGQ
jgi:hypothetical protein